MKRILYSLAALLLLLAFAGCGAPTVANNKMVSIDYKLTLADGTLVDESPSGQPLEFMVGARTIIPGLEKELLGLKVGDKKTVTVKAADAYGEYDKEALRDVPKSVFPKDTKLSVGQQFQISGGSGPGQVIKIAEIKKDTVTVDFNHPLAGKDLTFAITVVKIRDATKEELANAKPAAPPASK